MFHLLAVHYERLHCKLCPVPSLWARSPPVFMNWVPFSSFKHPVQYSWYRVGTGLLREPHNQSLMEHCLGRIPVHGSCPLQTCTYPSLVWVTGVPWQGDHLGLHTSHRATASSPIRAVWGRRKEWSVESFLWSWTSRTGPAHGHPRNNGPLCWKMFVGCLLPPEKPPDCTDTVRPTTSSYTIHSSPPAKLWPSSSTLIFSDLSPKQALSLPPSYFILYYSIL